MECTCFPRLRNTSHVECGTYPSACGLPPAQFKPGDRVFGCTGTQTFWSTYGERLAAPSPLMLLLLHMAFKLQPHASHTHVYAQQRALSNNAHKPDTCMWSKHPPCHCPASPGTYAEYIAAAENTLETIPPGTSFQAAAAVPLAALTAWQVGKGGQRMMYATITSACALPAAPYTSLATCLWCYSKAWRQQHHHNVDCVLASRGG